MPPIFEEAFFTGMKDGGIILPLNWWIAAHLLNLLSLLDLIKRSNPKTCSNRCVDIGELAVHILSELDKAVSR